MYNIEYFKKTTTKSKQQTKLPHQHLEKKKRSVKYKTGQCSRQSNKKKMSALMHYGNRKASHTFLQLFFLGQH